MDLFCGAGGASTGLELALQRLGMTHKGIAINHWSVAVDTMKLNHPLIETKQMSIEEAVPADMVPGGVVDLLWASPSCTHHSRAKGGKPRSNQLRAQPELVLTWLDQLFVRRVIIENVPEFVEWGPLDRNGKPIKAKVGECFRTWVAAIEARNYQVEWRIVNCADYGDATTRRRFFLKAVRRGCGRINWPEPTHAENPQPSLFGPTPKRWRGIRECLDLEDTGKSIFNRSKPLAANTLRRIAVGLRKFCGIDFQMDMLGAGCPDESRIRPTDKPMVTQHAGGNRVAIVRPFLVKLRHNQTAESVDHPISTVSTSGAHHALCTPFVFTEQTNNAPRPIEKPIRAQTCVRKDYICTPLVLDHQKNGKATPTDSPIGAQPTHDRFSLIMPLVLGQQGGAAARPIDEPCPTIATVGAIRGIFPMLEDGRVIDIRIRMLKPSELAAAHSFPKDYVLTGNRGDKVKQIGNSVPVMTAAAMCQAEFQKASRQ